MFHVGIIWAGGLFLIGVFLKLYLWGPGKGSTLHKAAATFVSVLISLDGALRFGGWAWVLFIAVLLCMAADIWIQYSLIPGVLVFLSAHLFFIGWMALKGGVLSWNLLIGAAICGLLLWLYRRYLKGMGAQAVFLSLYLLILMSMLATALSLPFVSQSAGASIIAGGASLFAASDLILGASIVTGRKTELKDRLIMLFYEPAVFLLAVSVFYF